MDLNRLKTKGDKDGWHCRGYLPHLHVQTVQFITFRLADSVPNQVLDRWKSELSTLNESARRLELYRRVEAYADNGVGSCFLRQEVAARIVEAGLLALHNERMHLMAWVIMPNHIHFVGRLFEGEELDFVLHDLKGASARYINRELGRDGTLWAREYFDRFMRSRDQLDHTIQYVHRNPVKARLCSSATEFPFSSSRYFTDSGEGPPESVCTEARVRWQGMRAGYRWSELEEDSRSKVG